MTVLDASLRATFGAVFGALYDDATWETLAPVDNGKGGWTSPVPTTSQACKANLDKADEKMLNTGRVGFTADYNTTVLKAFILQQGFTGAPNTLGQLILGGKRYAVDMITEDPARTHWVMRAQELP